MSPTTTPPTRRPTRQRSALTKLLSRTEEFLSAQDLHARLAETGASVGLATVYRNLQALADEGRVDVLRTDDGEAIYRACSTTHHHHLVCTNCGRTIEVEAPEVEAWADRVSAKHGFTDIDHSLEVYGTCPDCS